MASAVPGLVKSFTAGGAIVAGVAVKMSASKTVVVATASTDIIVGVSQRAAASGETIPVYLLGPTVRMLSGAAMATAGVQVMADSAGKAIAATATNMVIGVNIETAAAADLWIEVMLGNVTVL